MKPRIKIVSTGGTIVNMREGLIGMEEFLKDVPEARTLVDLDVAEVS